MWPSASVPSRAPGGRHGLTVDLRRHAPPAGLHPGPGGFSLSMSYFRALVAQRQRHGVQDAISVSSTLTEGTHHNTTHAHALVPQLEDGPARGAGG